MPILLIALIMNWFIVKIVFNITAENTAHTPQFDEQLRLVAASNRDEAFLKARIIGLQEEDAFFNDKQNRVTWEFVNVAEVIPVGKLEDGAELYSQIHETSEPNSYINCIHQKAVYLRTSALSLQ